MFDDKGKYLILGLGKSGQGAVIGLSNFEDCQVAVTDRKNLDDIRDAAAILEEHNVPYLNERESVERLSEFDILVKSPGIPMDNNIITKAKELGMPVIDELELGYQILNYRLTKPEERLIAVTGTNGKTTTTNLIGEFFEASGYSIYVAGNVGLPLSQIACEVTDTDFIVLEVSSFQLEFIKGFRPKVSMILNITPDHLDWHGDLDSYIRAKMNIFKNQTSKDFSVVNVDDETTFGLNRESKGRKLNFSKNSLRTEGSFIEDDHLVINYLDTKTSIIHKHDILLPGEHNLENVLAATTATLPFSISEENIRNTLKAFSGVDHRLELVRELNGVKFINDSKGTNVEASLKAINSFDSMILIAGGKDKGADFSEFAEAIKEKGVKKVYLFGETYKKIASALDKVYYPEYYIVNNLETAVTGAYQDAISGDVVLLSPACASWDMYDSFEKRGNHFKSIVYSLGGE
ncbi:UDP-N-acetylmuramoyl-L-alanine--D-glutamate ligase [Natranaerobius thermophilus]|uniref:UDP-N-acetylmuramoylalanine--D-glutamate ligase n=1 Tax=Natranaerobius thermophilus (strain ATCC BAA-1301 / DSM 18059 / JW/NM-WN-LF) TaxID=457570 RepID=MURD_NATTJ|nr:UDP-N-acetylmuramoyl-L-alanine--D-glutamate ligase [Natranaerobius thermophilus]B2A2H0.1 RecName: Full=UDP-N-acetylmuramoylalanine--D-glutamate ligase; AltName: Full=D-glutamic acid-adding enzyme; AltName: Full=UDP-N-acetylmuramoyl-L-alanyl-D-glutamate synthetase [Natranaerobius thermophilus JW/NM-WN-LF]ACB84885.1 UDP-N-acetylmuramoylalanine--D-glutamate ligase [Natranaerobius thermophilus JW/NM-WN-LF]